MRADTYQILREAWGSPMWAKFIAYPIVFAGIAMFVAMTAWSLRILERGDGGRRPGPRGQRSRRLRMEGAR
jgi:uncharacterized membrane protein